MKCILIVTGVIFACLGCKNPTQQSNETTFRLTDTMLSHTEFAEATVRPVTAELKLFGKVTAANDRQAQVFPVVGGNVMKVNVELGDFVNEGQVLAVIKSGEVAEYERQRLDAASDLAIAEKNLQVAKDMFEGKLAPEKEVLIAEKDLQKAKAGLKRINEIFGIYRLGNGSTYNVIAPISGFIIDKNVTSNMQLRNDRSENMFSIAQINEVWVLANVNETDIRRISEGIEATIKTISYPDRIFTGKVDKIFNVLDDNTKSMKVRITIPNPGLLLKPEMNATVYLQVKENKEMLAIPSTAVIFDKSRNWVMVYKDRSKIETRAVEVYSQFGNLTYIQSGINTGEKIVTKNQLLIYDALND